MTFGWSQDKVNHEYRPTLYPGEETDSWEVPEGISSDFHRLNSIIEGKYSREFLKICAFFNKMFPSLKSSAYAQSSYNVPPFTSMEQERGDTGYGTNYNYLKQIVDQITSRLGTISFVPRLMSEEQSYEYVVYKDEVEDWDVKEEFRTMPRKYGWDYDGWEYSSDVPGDDNTEILVYFKPMK